MESHVEIAKNLQEENADLREEITKLRQRSGRLERENERLQRDGASPPSAASDLSLDDRSHHTEGNTASAAERIALIHENLQEVLKPEIIEDVIKRQNRPLVIYWGADA